MASNKKNALITLYKLWSAFSKNIRYIIDSKGNAVTLARFGTLTRREDNPKLVSFIPSSELVNGLNATRSSEQSFGDTTGPEWAKIASAASIE